MPTIDSIKIGLGIDAQGVVQGVQAANTALDKLKKDREANVTIRVRVAKDALTRVQALETKIQKIGDIEVGIKIKAEDIRVTQVRKAIADALEKDGGIPVPITLKKMTKAEISATRQAIRNEVGVVTLDWQFAATPTGGFPKGGGPGPSGSPPPPSADAGPSPSGGKPRQPRNGPRAPKGGNAGGGGGQAAPQPQPEPQAGPPPEEGLKGTGGRTKPRPPAKPRAAKTAPKGAPRPPGTVSGGNFIPSAEGERRQLGAGDRGMYVGTGKEHGFRGGSAPRDLSPLTEYLTPRGIARARGVFGKSAEDMSLHELRSSGVLMPGDIKKIKRGELPKTINPRMHGTIERREAGYLDPSGKYVPGTRHRALQEWARKMSEGGLDFFNKDDRTQYRRSLDDKGRRRFSKAVGRALETLDTDNPEVFSTLLGYAQSGGARYAGQVEYSAGGIANRNAGARLKSSPAEINSGGEITAGAVDSALKQAAVPVGQRKPIGTITEALTTQASTRQPRERPPKAPAIRFEQSNVKSRRGVTALRDVDAAAGADIMATGARADMLRAAIADAPVVGPYSAISAKPKPGPSLAEVAARVRLEGSLGTWAPAGTATPANYSLALARAMEKRYAQIRKATGREPMTGGERQRAVEHFKFSAASRADAKLRKLTIPGLAEGGSFKSRFNKRTYKEFLGLLGTQPLFDQHMSYDDFQEQQSGAHDPDLMAYWDHQYGLTGGRSPWNSRKWHGIMPWSQNAEGGEVKHTGLLGRMASRGDPRAVTMVGERGPELLVSDEAGKTEVVPTHQVPTWIQRMREGQMRGKDLTHRAGGGTFFGNTSSGRAGFIPEPRAVVEGRGLVQRVFVVNWPGGFQGGGGHSGGGGFSAGVPGGHPTTGMASSPANAAATPSTPGVAGALNVGPVAGKSYLPLSEVARVARETRIAREPQQRALREAQGNVAVALQENPVRAFAVAVSQFVATKTGRGELVEKAKQAQLNIELARGEANLETQYRRELDTRRAELDLLQHAANPTKAQQKRLAELQKAIPDLTKRYQEQSIAANESAAAAIESSKGLSTLSGQITNLAVGGLSVIGAGVGFSAVFNAVNALADVGGRAAGDLVERTTGYQNATAALSKTLGESTKTSHNAEASTRSYFAQIGLSGATSDRIVGTLSGRAQGVAGNSNLQSQLEATAAALNIDQENQQHGVAPGFDLSLFRGTGGPFDLGLLPGILSQRSTADVLNLSLQNGLRSDQAKGGIGPGPKDLFGPYGPLRDPFGFIGGRTPILPPSLGGTSLTDTSKALTDLTNALAKGGGAGLFQFQTGQGPTPFKDTFEETDKALRALGDDGIKLADTFKELHDRGVQFAGPTTPLQAQALLNAEQKGGLAPSANDLIGQLTSKGPGGLSQLDVQLRDIARRSAFQEKTTLPASIALRFAANPQVPFNDARLQPTGGIGGAPSTSGVVAQYKTAFDKYSQFALPAQAAINKEIEAGKATLDAWISPELRSNIEGLGKSIQGIQLDIGQRNLNLQVASYDNELRIANRELKIAKDTQAGIAGHTKDTLGGLQGQNIAMQRQLQLLGFAIQQRSINLQLATAGFQVAGETPEERAARQAQAQAEAEFAQKQLDLQEKLGKNDFAITAKQITNSITDLSASIGLLAESKSLAIDSYAAEQAIKAMNDELDILEQKAQVRFDSASKMAETELSIIADIEKQTTEVFDAWQNKLFPAFRKAGKEAGQAATDYVISAISEALNIQITPSTTGGAAGRGTITAPKATATGDLFNTTGPTGPVIFGEAGTETVAILRNPRTGTVASGGGGGTATVVVNINNPSVRQDSDITRLARVVQEELNRSLRLAGLR